MKHLSKMMLLFAWVLLAFAHPPKKIKVLFFGDSITQAGANPGGYIRVLDTLLRSKGVSDKYELVGAGIGGNKIYDLYLRMEDDVLAKNPDVVVIAGGVTLAGEALFEPLRMEVRRRAFRPAVQAVRIVPGELPGTAGVVGAVAAFRAQMDS